MGRPYKPTLVDNWSRVTLRMSVGLANVERFDSDKVARKAH